jgi:hypothetical protein
MDDNEEDNWDLGPTHPTFTYGDRGFAAYSAEGASKKKKLNVSRQFGIFSIQSNFVYKYIRNSW